MSKPPIDWERIEFDYRAGILSLREIAALHPNTNHVAITRRAKKYGWVKDLTAKIKARADELVTRQVVTVIETAERAVTEKTVVEANAFQIAQVRNEHRADIRRFRRLVTLQLSELEALAEDPELFEKLGEMMRKESESGLDKLNDAYHKVVGLSGRVDNVKKLAETLKHLVGLEREAYDIAAVPMKLDVTANVTSNGKKTHELTDDELFAIATGGSAGVADPSQSKE